MDDCMVEAEDMWDGIKQKNRRAYESGTDNSHKHTVQYKAQIRSGASYGAMEINHIATLKMLALKCLLKKNKIGYLEVMSDTKFKAIWKKKIKKLCDKIQKPKICDRNAVYRTFDGTCNNLKYPLWGAAMTPQIRLLRPKYDDREMGSAINCCGGDGSVDARPACIPITIPKNDPHFGKYKKTCMNVVRSLAATDHCGPGHREQLNEITSFIDASGVYGSSEDQAKMLRTGDGFGAFLKMGPYNLLPKGSPDTCDLEFPKKDYCQKAGDGRVNEVPSLSTMHTLFMREHNRIAQKLGDLNPRWSDESVFQETRRILAAFLQHINYNEYLAAFLSKATMRKYNLRSEPKGYADVYNKKVNPSIMNAFSTAAFRQGHSLVENYQATMNKKYSFTSRKPVQSTFMDPHMLMVKRGTGVDGSARWLTEDPTSLTDRVFGAGIRDRLFESKPGDSLDLPAINIQRGRDHGLPGYNDWRVKCGLSRAKNFNNLKTHDEQSRKFLAEVYRHVDDVDLYAGAISEKLLPDSFLGPTFTCLLGKQFRNLKVGDRFWYETPKKGRFTQGQLAEIKKVSLAKVICNNFEVGAMQPNVFKVPDNGSNKRVPCDDLPDVDLSEWKDKGSYGHK